VPQNRYQPPYDVYDHGCTCDARAGGQDVVRWPRLLHDIGKPRPRVERGGEGRSTTHSSWGASSADGARAPALSLERAARASCTWCASTMFDYRRHGAMPRWALAATRR